MRLFVSDLAVRAAYEESPIPVVELTRSRWLGFCNKTGLAFPSDLGAFYFDVNMPPIPSVFVVINRTLANYKKLAVLRHELSHYRCYQRGCHCIAPEVAEDLCEAHAILSSLLHFITRKDQAPLLFSMEMVVRSLFMNAAQCLAAIRVIRDPLWNECEAVAGTFFSGWIKRHPHVQQRLTAIKNA